MPVSKTALDISSLRQVFINLKSSCVWDVPGVYRIDSGKSGQVVGVTICTHGNEPAGLAVAKYLMSKNFSLESGTLYLICNNLKATERFFAAECDKSREDCRFLEANMNRIPADCMEEDGLTKVLPYEWRRSHELYPVWRELRGGVMDIHSTSAPAPSMLIVPTGEIEEICPLISGIPASIVISGISQHIHGKFMVDFCGIHLNSNKIILECGQHMAMESQQVAVQAVQVWLHNLGMAALPDTIGMQDQLTHYHVFSSVNLPLSAERFYLVRQIGAFEWLEEGAEVARGEHGSIICSPTSGYAVMCPKTTRHLCPDEAVLFLANAETYRARNV